MMWSEIDLTLGLWNIPAAKFKTGESHTVTLNSIGIDILKRRRQLSERSLYVFPGRYDGHMIEIRKALVRVSKRANITNLRCHDLRRSLASYLVIAGESQYIIGSALGHKDARSTAIYARLNLAPVKAACERVVNNWQNLLALPVPQEQVKLKALPFRQNNSSAKNANVAFSNIDQAIIEGKILTALRAGSNTKKGFYKKIGGQFQVNSLEMQRILNEMIDKKLIARYQEDSGAYKYDLVKVQAL